MWKEFFEPQVSSFGSKCQQFICFKPLKKSLWKPNEPNEKNSWKSFEWIMNAIERTNGVQWFHSPSDSCSPFHNQPRTRTWNIFPCHHFHHQHFIFGILLLLLPHDYSWKALKSHFSILSLSLSLPIESLIQSLRSIFTFKTNYFRRHSQTKIHCTHEFLKHFLFTFQTSNILFHFGSNRRINVLKNLLKVWTSINRNGLNMFQMSQLTFANQDLWSNIENRKRIN